MKDVLEAYLVICSIAPFSGKGVLGMHHLGLQRVVLAMYDHERQSFHKVSGHVVVPRQGVYPSNGGRLLPPSLKHRETGAFGQSTTSINGVCG